MLFHFLLDPELQFRIRIQAKNPDPCGSGSTTLHLGYEIGRKIRNRLKRVCLRPGLDLQHPLSIGIHRFQSFAGNLAGPEYPAKSESRILDIRLI